MEEKPKSQQADCLSLDEFFAAFNKGKKRSAIGKGRAKPKPIVVTLYEGGCTKRDATYFPGIDPDVKKSGLSVWQRAGGHRPNTGFYAHQLCYSFDDLLTYIEGAYPPHLTYVKVSAGWLNKVINFHKEVGERRRAKIAADIGANHLIGKQIVEQLVKRGYTVELVKPTKAKWTPEQWTMITGLVTRNQELIDSGELVFNS